MQILIIGGTRFQGRYLVNELLDAGHRVTVFHRGSHPIESRSGLEHLIGDRNASTDLAVLRGRKFDACIDICAYFPSQIKLLADFLNTGHYYLISSVYVYADRDALLREDSPLSSIHGGPSPRLTPENYGALKALCEHEAIACYGNSCLAIRPSIIIGMGDHTERLQFWMRFFAVHSKRLEIVGRNKDIQLVDVRDLARFTATCVKNARQGAVNVCGESVSFSALLDAIEAISGRKCDCRSANFDDLINLGLRRLPYCESGHLARHDNSLSRDWGFAGRSLKDSIEDIFTDLKSQGFLMRNFQDEEAAVLRLFA